MINEKYMERLSKQIDELDIDAILIGPSKDLEFATGFLSQEDERFQGLFILRNGRCFYISPKLNKEEIEHILGKNTKIYSWDDGEGFTNTVKYALAENDLSEKKIAVNCGIKGTDLLDMTEIFRGEFINGIQIIEDSRIIKTKEEVVHLKKAGQIADEVMEALTSFIKPGMKEKDIKKKIIELFLARGSEIAFEPIVASGPNSSKPYYNQDDRIIQEKDVIILDLGCRYKGCCSDISRTFFIGKATEEEKQIYQVVLEANQAGKSAVKEGVTAEYIDRQARSIIHNAGYGNYFFNRVGHGIGFSVHEAPYIREGNCQIIKNGMAFSIEPGIYLPGKFGVRVEDIIVVGGNGPEVMNHFERNIIIL
ncbi:Xaa-Pro aminopeptidase [Anaerosolibacter carboniphilus]|uniref:Xaa-Pro aminopeptidase n=1 Tax=Anaerosolibacter carboniphilus TaxID=1417629 RepID=A0A841KRQ5_9FIRM|nr:Xaa-Pro peptidase family protein [Anaerosolibacter carboniphilus]MBB6216073.1 Xaa-Pro aminopeptidase [Anaerosolibacter carboniphilus]